MKTTAFKFLSKWAKVSAGCLLMLSTAWSAKAQTLVVPPSPGDLSQVEHLKQSNDYTVEVKKSGDTEYTTCFVYKTDNYAGYQHGGSEHRSQVAASFTNISFSGTSVDVRVTTSFAASSVTIRPLNLNINPVRNGNVITFTLSSPKKISIEVNNRLNPLFLFADAPDVDPGPANVTYYFGPGIHNVGFKKVIKSNESVYFAPGSVVEGTFKIPTGSSNIKFFGRGIFSGGEYPHTSNNVDSLLKYAPFSGSGMTNVIHHVTWEGITIVNSASWVFAAASCFKHENHHNEWHNLKQVNWCGNTDAIWFDGDNNVVDDCFFFANDDITTHGSNDCTLSNIVFWQGKAGGHIFMTYDFSSSKNIKYENIDIIGCDAAQEIVKYWGGTGNKTSCNNISFKNMRIESHPYAGTYWTNKFIRIIPKNNSAKNWLFENITIDDKNADEGDFFGTGTGGTIDSIIFRDLKMKGAYVTSLAEANMDKNAYATNIEFQVSSAPEINIKQGAANIPNNSGSYMFGNVGLGGSKTATFTIENKGSLASLNLTGTPKILVSGAGFSLSGNADSIIAAGGTTSFSVKFESTTLGLANGNVSIENNDLNEAPYNFSLSAVAIDSTKGVQTITFGTLPVKNAGDADFMPGAFASSGLPVVYTSSNLAVATIINGKIHIVGPGSSIITASQPGNDNFNAATDVQQNLTVAAAGGANLIGNPTFDTNTSGWLYSKSGTGAASIASVSQSGYSGKACKVTITNGGTASFHVQLNYLVPIEKDKTYSVKFKASADSARTIDFAFQQNASPYKTYFSKSGIAITTTPTTYGPFIFNSTFTDAGQLFKFWLGNNKKAVYIDDVEVTVVPAPEANIKQGGTNIADNSGSFSFGGVQIGQPKTVSFDIENLGQLPLSLTGANRIVVTGAGFSLASDADSAEIAPGTFSSFQVQFDPAKTGLVNGTISIANNDANENPYNFAITATGLKADQSILFDSIISKTFGDADFTPGAIASSGLLVQYTSSDSAVATIVDGKIHIIGAGFATIMASQPGDSIYNAALTDSCILNIAKANQSIGFEALAPKTFGEADFAPGAIASSGLEVLYESSNTSVVSIVNGKIHIVAAGNAIITAMQGGNANYNAAEPVSQTITVAPMILEAEDAILYLGKVFSNKPGFNGSGFVGHLVPFKGYIEWNVNAPDSGFYELSFRYSLAASARTLNLAVNGTTIVSGLIFPNTGGWSNWETVTVVAWLNAGPNTVRTTASLASVPNMDNLGVARSTETAGSTTLSEFKELLGNWVVLPYPNPATNQFMVDVQSSLGGQVQISLYNLSGKKLLDEVFTAGVNGKNTFVLDVTSVQQGMYLVKVVSGEGSKSGIVVIKP